MKYFIGFMLAVTLIFMGTVTFINDACRNGNIVGWDDDYILVCYPIAEVK